MISAAQTRAIKDAESVLHIFSKAMPGDERVADCIRHTREFLEAPSSAMRIIVDNAAIAAGEAADAADFYDRPGAAYAAYAARNAALAAIHNLDADKYASSTRECAKEARVYGKKLPAA